MASGRVGGSQAHSTPANQARASSGASPYTDATCSALSSPPALNSAQMGRMMSSRARTVSASCARYASDTATTKHGHGVGPTA
eukprot:CAMPEP_0172201740 /NCGR_PEP_ID=MMETSP1050-20130122/30201_1 /TAXON_ID=233186 /ORGANISM="Cryptomonas curvata, Strain CCAP979/52" /LENGTH=82 /DNA_ID=CAMNT_0012879487 /DNA_START=194 /DNA_END=442 /DNA_ORIENTATION=+